MKETIKDLAKSTVISIGMAMAIFCLVGIVFDIGYKGNFSLENYKFTKMVIGCVLVGLGFGVPTIVYRKENAYQSFDTHGNRMCGLYNRCICCWMDRRIRYHWSGNYNCGDSAGGCISYLVPFHEILSCRSKEDE